MKKTAGTAGEMSIALTGFKGSGKSRIGKMLAKKLCMKYTDLDAVIEDLHRSEGARTMRVRTIYKKYGRDYFLKLEAKALERVSRKKGIVLSLGGGTPLNAGFRKKDFRHFRFVHLDVKPDVLYRRITAKGLPPFFDKRRPRKSFDELYKLRSPAYRKIADITVENTARKPSETADEIMEKLEAGNGG